MSTRASESGEPSASALLDSNGMDSSIFDLPTVLLEDIHRRVVDVGGIRSAMALESTCRSLCYFFRTIALADVHVQKLNGRHTTFWHWNLAHGHRVGHLNIELGQLGHDCPAFGTLRSTIQAQTVSLNVQLVSTLKPLEGLTALTSLQCQRLAGNGFVSLEPLTAFTALQSLMINNSPGSVPTLRPLTRLSALTNLTLLNLNCATNLTLLRSLTPRLQRLQLSGFRLLTDLDSLSTLTSLTRLCLEHFPQLEDLGPVGALSNLRRLRLASVACTTDLVPLSYAFTALSHLELQACTVLDLEPITVASGDSLQVLRFHDCELPDLSPLSALRTLRSLDAFCCKPACPTLHFLAPMASLQSVRITCSRALSDLTPLAPLTSLSSLELLGASRVTTLSPLRTLTALQQLNISHCKISTLAPLRPLTGLQQLRCRSCKMVSSLEPLHVLTALKQLDLRDCPLINARALPCLQHALHNLRIM